MPKKSPLTYKYNPALSVKENAERCAVSVATINQHNKTILFDFDDTLLDTTPTKSLRSVKTKDWESIYEQIPNCKLYDGFNDVFDFISQKMF